MIELSKKRTLRVVGLLAVLVLTLAGCSALNPASAQPEDTPVPAAAEAVEQAVIAEGNIEPAESRYLSFAQPGTVAEVLVQKGDQVAKDQVLARLSETEDLDARLQAAQLEQQAAQIALQDLERTADLAHAEANTALLAANQAVIDAQRAWDAIDTQATEDAIEDARTKVADAQKELDDAIADFEPYEDLPEDNAQRESAQQTLDDAQDAYDLARQDLDELVNNYELAQANLVQAQETQAEAQHRFDQTASGPDPDQLKLAQDRLQAAQAQILAIESAYASLEIKAPFAGEVMDVNILVDELFAPGNWAVLLADTSQWFVRTNDLTELEVVKIQAGQPVELSPDALPELVLTGVVEEISSVFRTQTGDILYDVRIRLDGFDPRLRWGMTVEVNFGNED